MTVAPKERGDGDWTVDDYMALDDDQRYELIDGELVMVPSPDVYHQRAVTKLGTLIDVHVTDRGLGECFHAPFDVVLGDDRVLQPDFTFVRDERFPELYDGHCITGAPDLVIEVLSASTESRDQHRKARIYAEAGVEWLLFVEPETRVVEVQKLDADGEYATVETAAEDDILAFELFPDLAIELDQVWFVPPEEEG